MLRALKKVQVAWFSTRARWQKWQPEREKRWWLSSRPSSMPSQAGFGSGPCPGESRWRNCISVVKYIKQMTPTWGGIVLCHQVSLKFKSVVSGVCMRMCAANERMTGGLSQTPIAFREQLHSGIPHPWAPGRIWSRLWPGSLP